MDHVLVCDTKSAQEAVLREQFEDRVAVSTGDPSTPAEVIELGADADAIIVDANVPVTRAVIEALDLAVIGRSGIGVDNVDLEAAAEADVPVVHVPDYCIDEVSTNALALLLACVRNVTRYDRSTRAGEWDWRVGQPMHRLRGQTLGMVAFGDIARRTARKLEGFGLDLLAYDPYVPEKVFTDYAVESVSFERLVAAADHLSIHAPLTAETRGLIDASVFESLPSHGVIVNHGRGPIVEEAALLSALEAGEIAAAGLDVLAEEPPSDPAILEHDRTAVTPHSAWYSEESMQELVETVATDVVRVLDGEQPVHPVDTEWA
jgi:D-3-phosphoglycerate dehydrogenase